MKDYVEKMFDQFNKSVIYSFLSYFLSSCFQKLVNKDILIDLDLKNFILIRDGLNIKFVYLVSFENFGKELDRERQQQHKMHYEQFCCTYYHFDQIDVNNATPKSRLEKLTFNTKFQEKYKDLLVKIGESMLNEQDKKEANEDSQFAQDCLKGARNIEDALRAQDLRKRYCKVIINKNYILNAIKNNLECLTLFKKLYDAEQSNLFNLTQIEILNSFLQDVLKKGNTYQTYQPQKNDQEKDSIIEYICEEYPKQQNTLIVTTPNVVRDKSKTPELIQAGGQNHEIQSLQIQKKEMQIQLKIREQKFSSQQESTYKQKMDELKQKIQGLHIQLQQQTNDQIKANLETTINSHQAEIKQLEGYLNLQNQPAIRGGEKKIMIDFKESSCSISIKFYFQTELFVQYENIDEMLYCIQLLNNNFNEISIYMDDNKRIYFEAFSSMGCQDKSLLRLIFMIDSTITYALTFFEFYAQHMQNSKSSRDIGKYLQLQQEIQQYMSAYKYKFDEFKNELQQS